MKLKKFIKISPEDNTAVLLFDMGAGEKIAVDEEEITALDPIKYGHKIALSDISESEPILKYGEIIGYATCDIKKGMWVHTHNCE